MAFDSDRYRRRSIRLPGYDYSQAGAYFVTVVTQDRVCLFGNMVNGAVQLNEAGKIAQGVWDDIPHHYADVALDAFVAMPNHVHGIILIRAPAITVGAIHESPLQTLPLPSGPTRESPQQTPASSGPARIADRRRMLLSKIIGRFKMLSAKQINMLRETPGEPVWQRNYYEHIIRDEESLNRIRQYILDNPARWAVDRDNPKAIELEQEPTNAQEAGNE